MNESAKCFFCIMWFFPFPLLMWSNTLIHGTFSHLCTTHLVVVEVSF